jgi:hypothetical protein
MPRHEITLFGEARISGAHLCLSTDRLENFFSGGAMLSQHLGVLGHTV